MKKTRPSNPFQDGKGKGFTYRVDPSHKPFYVVGRTDWWIPISTLCFAKDEKDARSKLTKALKHILKGHDAVSNRRSQARKILNGKSELVIDVYPITPNQFFRIGWADNDTIF